MKKTLIALILIFVLPMVVSAGEKIDIIATEITVDPLARDYASMTDLEVANDMNSLYRPINSQPIAGIIKFLVLDNTYKEDDGDDTQDRAIWRRMKEVVALSDTPTAATANPWGSTAIGTITEIQQLKVHQLMEFFTLMAQGDLNVDVSDSKFQVYLSGAVSAGCMSTAQKNALIALANNQQSRASELGIGIVQEGNVQEARP